MKQIGNFFLFTVLYIGFFLYNYNCYYYICFMNKKEVHFVFNKFENARLVPKHNAYYTD